MPEYIQIFTVVGKGTFPFKMLLVERCWPADEESADELSRTDKRGLYLTRRVRDKSDLPLKADWAKCGWSVDMDTINTVRV